MQRLKLGSDLEVSALGLGCMGRSEFYGPRDDEQALRVLAQAIELGIDFLDTSDTYGPHHNEELIGRFLATHRPKVQIATNRKRVGWGTSVAGREDPGGRRSIKKKTNKEQSKT